MKYVFLCILLSSQFLSAQSSIYWTPPVEITGSGNGERPRIVLLEDGTPVVMFASYPMSGKNVFVTKWNGVDFNSPSQLNDNGLLTYDWGGTEISTTGDNVYVIYKEEDVTVGRVYLHHSADGGETWGPKLMVEDSLGELAMYPNLVAYDTNKVMVTYMEHETGGANPQYVVRTSFDKGVTFTAQTPASENYGDEACYCCPSSLALNDEYQVLFFRNDDSSIREMKIVYSVDGGVTFDQTASLDDFDWFYPSCPSSGADLVINGSTVYGTYMSSGEGPQNLYLVKDDLSDADPFVYDYAINSDSTDGVNHPVLVNYGDTLVLVWQQINGTDVNLWYNFSFEEMSDWDESNATAVQVLDGNQELPDLAIDENGTIHLVYRDDNLNKVMYRTGTFTALGISDSEKESFTIYPNPAEDHVEIIGVPQNMLVRILDVSGRLVKTVGTSFNTSDMNAGVYFVEIDGYNIQKLIVEQT